MRKNYIFSIGALALAISIAFAQSGNTTTTPYIDDEEEEVIDFCTSGGPGASSCSNSLGAGFTEIKGSIACSVSCNALEYACCNYYSCKCKPYTQNN